MVYSSYRYLFNTSGKYVAFLFGDNVFTPRLDWLGWIEKGNEFYDKNGHFVGYVLDDDRVAKNHNEVPRLPRLRKIPPLRPLPPLPPLPRLAKLRLPPPYVDVFEKE